MCEYNSKAFSRSSILATHMQTHTGENPHVCETQNSTTDAGFRRRIQQHAAKQHVLVLRIMFRVARPSLTPATCPETLGIRSIQFYE